LNVFISQHHKLCSNRYDESEALKVLRSIYAYDKLPQSLLDAIGRHIEHHVEQSVARTFKDYNAREEGNVSKQRKRKRDEENGKGVISSINIKHSNLPKIISFLYFQSVLNK